LQPSSSSSDISDFSILSSSDSHCRESDCCNRKVVNKSREKSKNDMDTICNKCGLDHDLVRLLVELDFDLEMHCKIEVNKILHNYQHHGE